MVAALRLAKDNDWKVGGVEGERLPCACCGLGRKVTLVLMVG